MYLLDSDALITAKNSYYRFETVPGFWEWLRRGHESGVVRSVRQVRDEILGGADELATWITDLDQSFFLDDTDDVVESLRLIATWVQTQGYEQSAVAQFLSVADYFLVASAHAGGHSVVSLEIPSAGRAKVKIPNVCAAFNIPCVRTFDMLKHEGVCLVLD